MPQGLTGKVDKKKIVAIMAQDDLVQAA